ncbi:MAG: response regulator transcription factor [Chloroflexi bacterium]|nr:response regulator transcription factor [Chloroflexota bacterium]
MIRVLLIAPSPALRAGLRSLLSSDDEIKIIDESNKWSDSLVDNTEADVVITTSASVASFSDALADTAPSAAILLLSDDPLNVRVRTRASHGVWGILPLDSSAEELIAAIRALSEGLIVGMPALLFPSEEETSARGPLTDREAEVLALLAKGLANKQIAASLGISEHTVKFHVSSIYTKLNVTNRTEAVREGLRSGWIAL